MKCPYCAETIGDGAITCRRCQRDLTLFVPIFRKLSTVEAAIVGHDTDIEALRHTLDPIPVHALGITVFLALSLFLSTLFYWISWQAWAETDDPWQILAALAPFLAALWLGAFSLPLTLRHSALLGLFAGLGGFGMHLLVYSHEIVATGNQPYLPLYWPIPLVAFTVAGTLLCPFGRALGAKLRRIGPPAPHPLEPKSSPRNSQVIVQYVQLFLGFLSPIVAAWIAKWLTASAN